MKQRWDWLGGALGFPSLMVLWFYFFYRHSETDQGSIFARLIPCGLDEPALVSGGTWETSYYELLQLNNGRQSDAVRLLDGINPRLAARGLGEMGQHLKYTLATL
jgi:hypothetical protein